MKKIISTLALATLAFGSAFADVKFTLNYKTQMTGFSRVFSTGVATDYKINGTEDSTLKAAETVRANSYMFKQSKGYATASDTFKLVASNDFGGVTLQVNPTVDESADTKNSLSGWKQYSGYVKLGAFTVNAGYWGDGVMAGSYQLKTDGDASGLQGETAVAYKLGSIHKNSITANAADITYLGGFNNNSSTTAGLTKDGRHATGYITYKGDVGDATITADLAAISLDGEKTWDGSNVYSALAARVDAKLESWDFEFTFKQALAASDVAIRSLALYAQPLEWGNLKATFGGALGFYNGELTEWAGDVRLRYADGPFSITSINNISYLTDNGAVYAGDYAKHVGAYFLNDKGAMKNVTNANAWSQSAMWNTILVRYVVNDTLAVFCNVGDIIGFNAGGKYLKDYGMEAFVAPGLNVYAGKGASISAAFRFGFNNLLLETDENKNNGKYVDSLGNNVGSAMALIVPVVIRVQL